MALAIEEMGYRRYGKTKSFFKTPPSERVGSYIIISGTKTISPDNDGEIKAAVKENNKNGEIIKVIIISRAGAEGIDFKYIRQIHLMEPWYNLNRIEQILGRGVRTCSHIKLPFEKRWNAVFSLASKVKRCGDCTSDGCGCKQPSKIKKEGLSTIFAEWENIEGDNESVSMKLTTEMVLKMFRRIAR